MTLIFDIGNTNIKTALFDGDKLLYTWRISTDLKRTGDEYFSLLRPLFRDAEIDFSKIQTVVLSTVVPALIGPFVIVAQHFSGKKPIIIGPDIYSKLSIKVPESAVHEIGTDLYCDAFEAWSRYKCPCIITDFGTALSFTAIDANANIAGEMLFGKTGTSQNNRDAWFIGYTPKYITGVWIGNDDNSSMSNSSYGGTIPAKIFKTLMTYVIVR